MKRTLKASEHQEQAAVISWWASYAATRNIDPRLLFAIPNAAKRSYALANRMRKEGMVSGIPDLMLARPKIFIDATGAPITEFAGLFLELKRVGEKATPAQLEMIDLLRKQGYNCIVAQGADEAIRALKAYIES